MNVSLPFEHRQSAHCESGVISALLRHAGVPMSEPMAFGISAGLTFAYIPLVKFGGMPMIAYRMPPKGVIRGLTKRLCIRMNFETFRDPKAGMAALDRHLAAGASRRRPDLGVLAGLLPAGHAFSLQRPQPSGLRQAGRPLPDQRSGDRHSGGVRRRRSREVALHARHAGAQGPALLPRTHPHPSSGSPTPSARRSTSTPA
jgi:hypothetical protein